MRPLFGATVIRATFQLFTCDTSVSWSGSCLGFDFFEVFGSQFLLCHPLFHKHKIANMMMKGPQETTAHWITGFDM